jgi:hypothetical protein
MALYYTHFNILAWDVMGYNIYGTQILVHHTVHIPNLDFYRYIMETYHNTETLYQLTPLDNGELITRYPCGWAILNAPFILIGHIIALCTRYPADGFSYPYQLMAFVSSLFYSILGIVWLRKLLLHFFSDKQSAILLVLVCLGTNYYFMNTQSMGIIHIFIFPFYALLILQSIRFHQTKRKKQAVSIGLIVGIMALCRPTEIVAIFIPLLWGIDSKQALKNRWYEIIKTQRGKYLSAAMAGFLCVFPQFLYWKLTTGHWIFDSYQNPGEGLDIFSPHTIPFLFSFRIGWWIYTPMMVLASLGFITLYTKNRAVFWSLFGFFVLNLYLVSSWTCWWYAGSFSSRAMMQSYPVMAISLGYLLFQNSKKNWFWLFTAFLFLGFNQFQTWQYSKGILKQNDMTWAYYRSVFGQTTYPSEKQMNLLLVDRNTRPFSEYYRGRHYVKKMTYNYSGKKPFILSKEGTIYSDNIKIPYGKLTSKELVWIRIKSIVEPLKENGFYQCHQVCTFLHKGKPYGWLGKSITEENRLTIGKKDTVTFDYLTPHVRSNDDILSVGLWLQGGDSVKVYDFSFEVWENKKE